LGPESDAFVRRERILCIESLKKLLSVLCVSEAIKGDVIEFQINLPSKIKNPISFQF